MAILNVKLSHAYDFSLILSVIVQVADWYIPTQLYVTALVLFRSR